MDWFLLFFGIIVIGILALALIYKWVGNDYSDVPRKRSDPLPSLGVVVMVIAPLVLIVLTLVYFLIFRYL